MKTLLVTGASGNLGRAVVAALAAQGYRVKAASRHPQAATLPNVFAVPFDYLVPITHEAALVGVDGVMLIAPPLDVDAHSKLIPFIDRAQEAGVKQFVLNSALGIEANDAAPLRQVELHLLAAGVNATILRPNFFMENFTSGFLAPMVKAGAIALAAADGKTSFISTRDIAAVAAAAFGGGHSGRAYNLTGPAALDHAEVAQLISAAAGRTVIYHAVSEEAMVQGAIQNGLPASASGFMAMLYTVVRNGWAAGVTNDVQQVTGRAPLNFADFARQHGAEWR